MELKIVPVTEENRSEAEALSLLPEQVDFIESVQECMEEADQLSGWRPVAIMADGEMVGFSMYGYIEEPRYNRLWFDRLLIDRRFQGRGYGRRAAECILETMKRDYPHMDIYLSAYEENSGAIRLYESLGFVRTGELDSKGEKIMAFHVK